MTERGGRDSRDEVELGLYRPGEEDQVIRVLAECHPTTWGRSGPELWHWKHPPRPGFRADEIIVARRGGRVVGCFHGATQPLRLAPGITVSASYDGDYAVLPEARGSDLTGRAYALTDPVLVRRGVAVRGGFTSRELYERHYGKKYGYVFVATATGQFRKIIGLGPLRSRVHELGERVLARPRLRRALGRRPLVVGLAVEGLPEAVFRGSDEGFTLAQEAAGNAPITVHLPYRVLASLPDGTGRFAGHFLRALLARRARVGGMPAAGNRLLQLAAAAMLPARPARGPSRAK